MKTKVLLSFAALMAIIVFNNTAKAQLSKTIPVAQHYEGGQAKLLADIKKAVVYPIMARRTRKQGRCVVRITLRADGSVTAYKVVKELGYGTGAEAKRVVKTLKFNAPGYDQDYDVPVDFSLK